jgi:hypothetical protein
MTSGWTLGRILCDWYASNANLVYYVLLRRSEYTDTIELVSNQKKMERESSEESRQIKGTMNVVDSVFNVNHNSRHDMTTGVDAK